MGLLDKKVASAEMGIDQAVYEELLQIFIVEAEPEIPKLVTAVEVGKFDVVAQLGHDLKGMAGNLMITPMQELAKTIEFMARQAKDKPAIMAKVIELRQNMAELKEMA